MDMYIVQEELLMFLVFIGLVPYARNKKFFVKRILLFYCRLILLIIFPMQLSMVYMFQGFQQKSAFMFFAGLMNTFGYGLTCFACIFYVNMRHEGICRVLNKIKSFWDKIEPGVLASFNDSILTRYFNLNFISLLVYTLVYSAWSLIFKSDSKIRFLGIVSLVFDCYILASRYLFVIMVLNMSYLFRDLNLYLAGVSDNVSARSRGKSFSPEKCWSRMSFGELYSRCTCFLDVIDEINYYFSEINLISSVYTTNVIMIVLLIYFQFSSKSSDLPLLDEFDVVYYIYFFLVLSFSVLLAMKILKDEVNATNSILHKIMSESDDIRFREELDLLCLQFNHRTVQFDAGSFFELDFSVLLKMSNSIITNGIILMQFEEPPAETSQNCTLNNATGLVYSF